LTLLIKIHSSEWCDINYQKLENTGYIVESHDIKKLGLKGEKGEKLDKYPASEKFQEANIAILVECEFDYPHIIIVYTEEKKIHHYSVKEPRLQ